MRSVHQHQWPVLLAALGLCLALFGMQFGAATQGLRVPEPSFAQQVIALTNAERIKAGLAPLRESAQLDQAALGHSQAMADNDFFAHDNPLTGTNPGQRLTAAGYQWTVYAENLGLGYQSPEKMVEGWMESPNHRANILMPDVREIGVGYVVGPGQGGACGTPPCADYWTQVFGARTDVYPIIIENEAFSTTNSTVSLYLYGVPWAQQMRLREDEQDFGPWQPFQSLLPWTFSKQDGERTITVEMRNESKVLAASDTIHVVAVSQGAAPTQTPALASTPLSSDIPGPAPNSVFIEHTLDPPNLRAGEETRVTLSLNGRDLPECLGIPGQPLDMVFVYDISSSAGFDNWAQTVTFTQQLLHNLEQPIYRQLTAASSQKSRIAIVTSQRAQAGVEPLLVEKLTDDYQRINAALNAIDVGNDTDITAGVELARKHLSENDTGRAQAIVLMLHDIDPIEAATQGVKEIGQEIPIYLVANSVAITPTNRVIDQLQATKLVPLDRFFPDPKPEELRKLFVMASQGDTELAVRDLHLEDAWDPAGFVTISEVSGAGGRTEGQRAVWDIPQIRRNETIELSYRIRFASNVSGNVTRTSGEAYIDCNGYVHNNLTTFQVPDLTPAPTNTPRVEPILTPTPVTRDDPNTPATPTPVVTQPVVNSETSTATAGVGPQPNPLDATPGPQPTPTATLAPTPPPCVVCLPRLSCFSGWRWLLLPILPLLALLLWLLVPGLRDWWKNARGVCQFCRWLTILYTIFLAFLIGNELFSSFCQPAETVYFWRLQGGVSGIYTIDPQGGAAPLPVRSQNSAGCVGCHTVSAASGQIAAVTMGGTGRLRVTTLDGRVVNVPEVYASYLAWSPDGKQLAYSANDRDIAILDLASGSSRPLSGASDPGLIETMPAWSADGKTIAFVQTARTGWAFDLEAPSDVYVVAATGGTATTLAGASGAGFNYYPVYSPDGKWLAFTHHDSGTHTYAAPEAEIWIVPASGGTATRLAANDGPNGERLQAVSNSWATWSRDSRLLAFSSKRKDSNYDIYIAEVHADGSSGAALPLQNAAEQGVFEHLPTWGPPPEPEPLGMRLLALWPWLLPLPLLLLICWFLCRKRIRPINGDGGQGPEFIAAGPSRSPADLLAVWAGPKVEWDPTPTLVIGVGGTGRWVLTHLKHNLHVAAAGGAFGPVGLLCIDSSREERVGGQPVAVQFAGMQLSDDELVVMGENLSDLIGRTLETLDSRQSNPPEQASPEKLEREFSTWLPAKDYQGRLRPVEKDTREGTGQRRPLGRAVVFHDIQQGEIGSVLWGRLVQALREVQREGQVQIVLVSSLAGGFGSGALIDIAYLARLAAAQAGVKQGLTVSAFLATEDIFTMAGRTAQMRVNTLATLRELHRFLLTQNRPYPMRYRYGERDDFGDRILTQSLLDDCYIFDGHRPQIDLTSYPPQAGTFPVMADALQILIDKAAREPGSSLAQYRVAARTRTSAEQVNRAVGVVSGLGCYTYRLPLVDLVQACNVRFARELVELWLVGRNVESARIRDDEGDTLLLDAQQNLENKDDAPPSLARKLLLRAAGDPLCLLAESAVGGWPDGGDQRLRGLGEVIKTQGRDQTIASEARKFETWLIGHLVRLLNGRPETIDVVEARTGKLLYAQQFLEEVGHVLDDGKRQAEMRQVAVGAARALHVDILIECAERYVKVVQRLQNSLLERSEFFLHTPSSAERTGGWRGLYRWLVALETTYAAQRAEMRSIRTRRTYAEEELVQELYTNYYQQHMEPALDRIFWRANERGELELVIRHWQDRVFTTDADGQATFMRALLELGEAVGKEAWRERLAARLQEGEWRPTQLENEAKRLWPQAEPLLTFKPGDASRANLERFLWASVEVGERQSMKNRIAALAPSARNTYEIRATDPYAAGLMTAQDVLPLPALRCYERTTDEYLRAHALVSGLSAQDRLRVAEPVQVFPAEVNALVYERRLHELREPARLFDPLMVAGLDDLDRARTFALAYALGLVTRGYEDNRYRYGIRLPDDPVTHWLPEHSMGLQVVDPLVEALQEYVLRAPTGTAEDKFGHTELLRRTTEKVESLLPESRDRLITFMSEAPPDQRDRATGLGVKDFMSFARLVILENERRSQ